MHVEKEGEVSVIRLPSRCEGRISRELLELVEHIKREGVTRCVVDMENTLFVDSSCIGALVSLSKEIRNVKGTLVLRKLSGVVYDLFCETGLDMIFDIERGEGVQHASVDIFNTGIDIKLDITREERGDVCIFHLSGIMNHPLGSRYFKQQFLLAIARYNKILLDFEELTFFDSLSVSVALGLNKLVRDTGGGIRLCNANYIVRDLFETLNIHQAMPTFDSIDEALADWVHTPGDRRESHDGEKR
ncbi:MAG: STAS domain-containing protein [Chitinivibrionales bacterium]|nr:STAS domain-containing protein [Chitinivibrionales bacterium]MBD3356973.1 STAS domain-containing protein [Chitinivibrionales bacterium]